MHLASNQEVNRLNGFYHNGPVLARRGSLAYLFYKLRIHRNLTKRSLSLKFGVTEDYLSRVEGGSRFPSLSFCLKCSVEFDVNPQYVKNQWAREAVERFRDRLRRRLELFD